MGAAIFSKEMETMLLDMTKGMGRNKGEFYVRCPDIDVTVSMKTCACCVKYKGLGPMGSMKMKCSFGEGESQK